MIYVNGRGLENRESHTTLPMLYKITLVNWKKKKTSIQINVFYKKSTIVIQFTWLSFSTVFCVPGLNCPSFLNMAVTLVFLSQTWKKVGAAKAWRQKEKRSVRELLVTLRKDTSEKHLVKWFWQLEDIPDKANLPHKYQRMASLFSTHHPP